MSAFVKVIKDTFVPLAPKDGLKQPGEGVLNAQLEVPPHTSFIDMIDYNECFTDVGDEEVRVGNKEPSIASKEESFSDSSSFEEGRIHRKLKRRQIELIAIGGTIGVSLFVNIGNPLKNGGPLSLLIAFIMWCLPILEITSVCAEMVCYLPIRGAPFCIFADRFVDEAFGVMASWNFWVLECALIPFELTLFNTLIHYWVDDYSPAIPLAAELVAYFFINVAAVKWYGEAEFWLCIGKVLLAVGLMLFTFITMVGGNPDHQAFGFTNWKHSPVMLEYITTGPLGRFQGWLYCLINASYMIAGPEYLSMAAGETINPRKVLPSAFKGVFFRLSTFFIGGALCVGILCNSRDPLLLTAITNGLPGAGSSPYTIAMHNMGIKVLPSVLNAALLTSCFSAGNSYTFCSSRTLYGLAMQGRAPKIFSYCSRNGVPIFCVIVSLCWGCLGFLQVNENTNTVLNWIINLITASQLINYCVILFTYLHFRRAFTAQGFNRDELTFKAWFQPWACIVTLVIVFIMVWLQGYTVFLPNGWWSVETFLFSYLMIFVDIAIFIIWKLYKRTKYRSDPMAVDLVTGLEEVEMHERMLERRRLLYKERPNAVVRLLNRVSGFLFGSDEVC